MRAKKKIKRNLEVALTDGLTLFARTLPRSAGLKVFSAMGSTAGRMLKKDRERALRNLELAFPEMAAPIRQALVRAMFKTLGQNAYEFLNLKGSSKERVLGLIERVEGHEHLQRAFNRNKGVIAVTGHIGCFELLAAYFANQGYEVNVVAREMWEPRIDERLVSIRESVGYHTIDRDSGGKKMLRILKNRGAIAVLMDQHTRVDGVYVPFFSRPAHTPVGVAKMALATGAAILPMAIYMTRPGRHMIRVLPVIEPPNEVTNKNERAEAITRECSRAIEDLIRFDPKQWVWFHRRWRAPEGADQNYAVAS